MGKKKVSNNQVRGISRKRMDILITMSEREALAGNMVRAKRYMELARCISGRNKVPMPPRAMYCHRCSTPLVAGINCRVRLREKKVCTHCLECDSIKRIPFIREIKERRTCRQEQ